MLYNKVINLKKTAPDNQVTTFPLIRHDKHLV